MIKKFRLQITEIQKSYVDVEAENIDKAQEMYLDEYSEGNIIWTDSTISEITAEEMPQNNLKLK